MNWELYEVWSVDMDGHEDLVDTTKSLKEARQLAKVTLDESDDVIVECAIYREDENGDQTEVERIK
jgi:hypothetical protein